MKKTQKQTALSSKDREIQKYLRMGQRPVIARPTSARKGTSDIPIPKKSVELSTMALNRLADHCESTGRKLVFHGLRIV